MFVCSMDHSPSEQLQDATAWHTTVLVLSESAAQWEAAGEIAREMQIQSGRLKKWTRYSSEQKGAFSAALSRRLGRMDITIAAVTARASTIAAVFGDLVAQLGLERQAPLSAKSVNGKDYVVWGPLIKVTDGGPIETSLPVIRSRFLPLIFIVHFMCRMHQSLLGALRTNDRAIAYLDWQVTADKFVGDIDGQMSKAFFALLGLLSQSQVIAGSLRDLTFLEVDEGSDLADNVAGMLRDRMSANGHTKPIVSENFAIGHLYWEIWREPADNRT